MQFESPILMIAHIPVFKQKIQINNDSTVVIKTKKQNLSYFNSVIMCDMMKFFICSKFKIVEIFASC